MSSDAPSYWDTRLNNWATWVVGGGGGRSSPVSSVYRMAMPGYRSQNDLGPIVLAGDAVDTDQLVRRLSPDLQRSVIAWFVWTGPIRERAGRLSVHENTLRHRVQSAKMKLADLDAAARAKAHRMRAQLAAGAAAR